MMRRFTAALLALIVLISGMPVRANADEVIYTKGQTLQISTDRVTMPYDPSNAYKTATGYMWQQVLDEDGNPKMECQRVEHTCDRYLCFDEDGNPTPNCPGAHKHSNNNPECKMAYKWVVVRDPNYVLWYDDPLAPENYELAVCCYEPDGIVPMANVGVKLFKTTEREVTTAEGTQMGTVNESILPAGAQSPVTNKNGYYYFTGECRSELPAGEDTWYLVQMAEQFQEGGDYFNQYRSNGIKWEVDVYVNGDGTYTVQDVRDSSAAKAAAEEEEDEIPKPVQGFDAANRRLVILNEPVKVMLHVDLFNVPASLKQLEVKITGSNGFEELVVMQKENGRWHFDSAQWEELVLAPAVYSIEANTGRYPVIYKAYRANEESAEGRELDLSSEYGNGFFEIHFASLSNTVKLYSVDENDKPITGAVYGIYREADGTEPVVELDSADKSVIVVDSNGWTEMAMELYKEHLTQEDKEILMSGGMVHVYLKQSRAPENHDPSDQVYSLGVRKTEAGAAEKFAVEMVRVEGSEDVSYGEQGEQIGTFRNRKLDMSYLIIPKAMNGETGEMISGASLYELTDAQTGETVETVSAGLSVDMRTVMEAYEGEAEFLLTQKNAPEGFALSEDSYAVTAEKNAEGKVAVELKKQDLGLLKTIVQFFTGDDIRRGDFNEWMPEFVNVAETEVPPEPVPEQHNNTVILRAVDENGAPANGAVYELYKDGAPLGVEFDAEGGSEITITSEDWMDVAMELYMSSDLPEEEKDLLIGGGSLYVTVRQIVTPANHEAAGEEYTLEVRRAKAADNIEDDFFVKVLPSENGEGVRYGSNDEQIATYINRKQDQSHMIIPGALDQESGAALSGAVFGLVYDGVTVQSGTTFDLKAVMEDYSGETEFQLSQKTAPEGYDLSEESYTILANVDEEGNVTVTLEKNSSGLLNAIAQFFSSDEIPRGSANEWLPEFHNKKTARQHSNTVILRAVDETGAAAKGAEYALFKDGVDLGVKFTAENSGDITITSDDWMDVAMQLYTSSEIPEEEKDLLMGGGSLYVTVRQTATPANHEASAEEYPLEVRRAKAEDKIEDKFFVKVHPSENGEGVRYGNKDEQIATYINRKLKEPVVELAQVSLTLNEPKIQWNDAEPDSGKELAVKSAEYGFVLSWTDETGAKSESIQLKAGETGKFQAQLPLGTGYKLTSADPNVDYTLEIHDGTADGTARGSYESTVKKAGEALLTADVKYEMERGDYTTAVQLVKVDAENAELTLSGAVFELKDSAGEVLAEYTTAEDGKLAINVLPAQPGSYQLVETTAPDGYEKLKAPVAIEVQYGYTPVEKGDGSVAAKQDLTVTAPDYITNTRQNVVDPNAKAKIHLSLNDVKIQWNDCATDNDAREYINGLDYTFALSWKDSTGKWQTDPDTLTLVNNQRLNSGTFKKEVPVGSAYKITVADPDAVYNVTFADEAGATKDNAYEATVMKAGDIRLTADVKYEMVPGEDELALDMVKVYARDIDKALSGAKFSLKGNGTGANKTFSTGKDGLIQITAEMLGNSPAEYTLKETEAPENYVKLSSAIKIYVSYEYTPSTKDGKNVIEQKLVSTVSNSSVTLGSDGYYYIKNYHVDDNPKTGDAFNTGLWVGVLALSAAGLAAVLVLEARKKRAAR